MSKTDNSEDACPLPIGLYDKIVMAHGGGGQLTQSLIDKLMLAEFDNPALNEKNDSAVLAINSERLSFTTDSYVVNPLFFPGGDIGKLAVCGTLNDLAMSGARPLFLSCGLIIEEGFAIDSLQKIIHSMSHQAKAAGVNIVTGDTKVVEKGKGDGLYINTSGIGVLDTTMNISPSMLQHDDVVIINGDIGRHGIAIMAQREGFKLEQTLESDCADLSGLVKLLLDSGIDIHCMRDLTRGGLATALIEISTAANKQIMLDETAIAIADPVRSVCEVLGLDPYYVANEGRFISILPSAQAAQALAIMHAHPLGKQAAVIGNVHKGSQAMVTIKNRIGTTRILQLLSGSQLPRIC